MIKKISLKAPLFMAACMAFALVLAGCGGSGSPADPGIVNGGGGGNGPGQQQPPPANEFTFDGVTSELRSAIFNELDEGYRFLLSTAVTPGPYTMNIIFTIPYRRMGSPIPLHEEDIPSSTWAWSWGINIFYQYGSIWINHGGRFTPTDVPGIMQVNRTSSPNRFRITVDATIGDSRPFSLYFYGEFTLDQRDVWDIAGIDY